METVTHNSSIGDPPTKKVQLKDRLWAAVLSDEFTDTQFIIGEGKVEVNCHRNVLGVMSPVFRTMFLKSKWVKPDEMKIELKDAEPKPFHTFLQFLYTGDLETTPDDVLCVRYLANKYEVTDLADLCLWYFRTQINVGNVLFMLNQSQQLNDAKAEKLVIKYICRKAEQVVTSAPFSSLSHGNLCLILGHDDLNIDEQVLHENALNWAKEECSRRNLENTPMEHRKVLDSGLYLIRFPLFCTESLGQVGQSGLLPVEDYSNLLEMKLFEQLPPDSPLMRNAKSKCKFTLFPRGGTQQGGWTICPKCTMKNPPDNRDCDVCAENLLPFLNSSSGMGDCVSEHLVKSGVETKHSGDGEIKVDSSKDDGSGDEERHSPQESLPPPPVSSPPVSDDKSVIEISAVNDGNVNELYASPYSNGGTPETINAENASAVAYNFIPEPGTETDGYSNAASNPEDIRCALCPDKQMPADERSYEEGEYYEDEEYEEGEYYEEGGENQ